MYSSTELTQISKTRRTLFALRFGVVAVLVSLKATAFRVEPHGLDSLIDSLAFGTTCSAKIRTWPSSSPSAEGQKMNVSNPKSLYDETSQSTKFETEPTNGLFSCRKNGFFSYATYRS